MLSSIRCCGLCEAGSSSSRQASSRAIGGLISPDACWLPSLPNRMLPIIPAPPRISSSTVAKLPLRTRHRLDKGFDIAVGGIMSGHHHHGQNVHADQRRAAEQHRQAFQRARMFARQGRQQFHRGRTRVANAPRPIARKVIRQPKYWPIMRPIGIPNTIASAVPVAIRLSACARLPAGGHADGQRRRYRPEHCMGKGDTNAADHQHVKIPCKNDRTWLAINRINRPISRRRRSTLLVSSINGSDINATTHA